MRTGGPVVGPGSVDEWAVVGACCCFGEGSRARVAGLLDDAGVAVLGERSGGPSVFDVCL